MDDLLAVEKKNFLVPHVCYQKGEKGVILDTEVLGNKDVLARIDEKHASFSGFLIFKRNPAASQLKDWKVPAIFWSFQSGFNAGKSMVFILPSYVYRLPFLFSGALPP